MAELTFFYGIMGCGKSAVALQMHHNAAGAGKRCLLFTRHDRAGAQISSRIGISHPATVIDDELDLFAHVARTHADTPVDLVLIDEAQFASPAQVDQLARLVDDLKIDTMAFGLATAFDSSLFPGSRRLFEIADRREELQVQAHCWCGARGLINARLVDGVVQRDGEQVLVGDLTDGAGIGYRVLCRRHWRDGDAGPVAHQAAA